MFGCEERIEPEESAGGKCRAAALSLAVQLKPAGRRPILGRSERWAGSSRLSTLSADGGGFRYRDRFVIVEEDSEAEYVFEGTSIPALAQGDDRAMVLHLFSFSRVVAPGLRLGLVAGTPDLIARLSATQETLGWEGDLALERAMKILFDEGAIQRHLLRARRTYQTRRDVTQDCLAELFGTKLEVRMPNGGLSLWIHTNVSTDIEGWKYRCGQQGIHFQTGVSFTLDKRPVPAFRLGYAAFESEEMAMILERMRQCF